MRKHNISQGVVYLVVVLALLGVSAAFAQSGGGFDLTWNTIDGGGGTSAGGSFTLTGASGQPDAGGPLSGGVYSLAGGFWGQEGLPQKHVWLPLVLR